MDHDRSEHAERDDNNRRLSALEETLREQGGVIDKLLQHLDELVDETREVVQGGLSDRVGHAIDIALIAAEPVDVATRTAADVADICLQLANENDDEYLRLRALHGVDALDRVLEVLSGWMCGRVLCGTYKADDLELSVPDLRTEIEMMQLLRP